MLDVAGQHPEGGLVGSGSGAAGAAVLQDDRVEALVVGVERCGHDGGFCVVAREVEFCQGEPGLAVVSHDVGVRFVEGSGFHRLGAF